MKPIKILFPLAFLFTVLVALPSAHAKDQRRDTHPKITAKRSQGKKKAAAAKPAKKKMKSFDFMADDITADRIRPDGTAIFGLQTIDHQSLIRLRTEFIAEIVKSAEML